MSNASVGKGNGTPRTTKGLIAQKKRMIDGLTTQLNWTDKMWKDPVTAKKNIQLQINSIQSDIDHLASSD